MKTIYPIFRKDNVGAYKIVDKDTCINVSTGWHNEIGFRCPSLAYALDSSEEATEAEFLEAFYSVRKRLNQLCDINFDLL